MGEADAKVIGVFLLADVKATEGLEKVRRALLNICPIAKIEVAQTEDITLLQGHAEGPAAIETLAKKFRDQRILDAVRTVLLRSIKDGRVVFGMHRQTAFVGRLHLCDLEDVSATGPIQVEIQAIHLLDVIDYIAPPTVQGKPQYRRDLQLE